MSKHRLVDLDQAIEEINDLVCSMSVCLNRSEYEGMKNMKRRILNVLEDLPFIQPEPKPISYMDCSDALLKMWIDNVLTDGEYNRIMDKLNAFKRLQMKGDSDGKVD